MDIIQVDCLIGTWLVLASHDNFRLFTVRSRSLRAHFQIINKFSISVREGVWGLNIEFEGIVRGHS